MSSEAYEILALLMRYVFVIIGLIIVWRSFRWLRRDARSYQKEMRSLPDAGLIGEIVNLTTGQAQPLPHEGLIGASRECHIRLKGAGIARSHARFEFEEGKGLRIIPIRQNRVLLSGVQVRSQGYALHGTQLQIGDALLRVRLFAGLKVPYPAAYPEPDGILDSGAYLESWTGGEEGAGELPVYYLPQENQEEDFVPYETGTVPPGAPIEDYEGHYTEDGQMTWQYAYSLDELRSAMDQKQWQQMQPEDTAPDEAEGLPYRSPLPRRRRRERRE